MKTWWLKRHEVEDLSHYIEVLTIEDDCGSGHVRIMLPDGREKTVSVEEILETC